jgi:hypothetical protein
MPTLRVGWVWYNGIRLQEAVNIRVIGAGIIILAGQFHILQRRSVGDDGRRRWIDEKPLHNHSMENQKMITALMW